MKYQTGFTGKSHSLLWCIGMEAYFVPFASLWNFTKPPKVCSRLRPQGCMCSKQSSNGPKQHVQHPNSHKLYFLSYGQTNGGRNIADIHSVLLPDSTSHVPINGLTCIQYAFDIRVITALATLSEWWDASFIPKSKILWILLKSVFSCSLRNWLSS